ncbi:MAG TPA: DNA polymerase Y family protein [Asticcacaulis sp.]|nr:DNA polymerase Y family protein [Asticcacaulis sp.]
MPLALKTRIGSKRVVFSADDLARRYGVYAGMPVARAQLLLPELQLLDADEAADKEGLEKLALWALRRYSPKVAADPPYGLVLDIAGCDHLFGGEAGLIRDLLDRLETAGVTAMAALADTWGAAHALARFGGGQTHIIPAGQTGDAIVKLPVVALRLPDDLVDELRILGIDTIGELAAKPRAAMTQRFGPELFRRIDQAFGRLHEPVTPVESPDLIKVERVFAEPIGAPETIEKYTRRLVGQICDRLEAAGQGARRLDLHHVRVDNRIVSTSVVTARPVRDVKRLSKLLCDKIEEVEPGFGIEKMVLIAVQSERLTPSQTRADFTSAQSPDVEDLWDTLANRYGDQRLYRAVSLATDMPERSVKRIGTTQSHISSSRNVGFKRPPRLYRKPEAIQALAVLPDHPPRAFTWRGQRYHVARADGPERIKGEWWLSEDEDGQVRDYYILEADSGERFWVFRTGDGVNSDTGALNWFLHGKFA